MEKFAVEMHCNLRPHDVAPVVLAIVTRSSSL